MAILVDRVDGFDDDVGRYDRSNSEGDERNLLPVSCASTFNEQELDLQSPMQNSERLISGHS